MSDTEKPISADEADDQHELTKEERLEAARKKFEEMKKKKKKSKKKKKEEGKEDTQEPEDAKEGTEEPEDSKEVTQEPEDAEEVTQESEDTKKVEDTTQGEETNAVVEPEAENIQKESPENSEISELKAKIEEQAKTIAKLRDENTDLKLGRMDLQDKVDELEHQIAQLKSNPSAGSTSSAAPVPVLATPVKPAKPVITTNDYASISQQNFKKFETTVDFRERLMIWKGWQVDMTNWNGTGAVTKVAI